MTPLHHETPLFGSGPLSRELGVSVWLKMEALQPVGSFKLRGIGAACQESVEAGATRLLCSSGGNAGLAVAYCGAALAVPVDVFVPRTTPERMREAIRAMGGTVTEWGDSWDDAHAHALQLAGDFESAAYIHPFDDARIWKGHSTLVGEAAAQLEAPPGAVVVSVGGGGLLVGVLEGLVAVGWGEVPVLAVETEGADSFAQSVAAGELVTLDRITSLATSLGARTPAPEALAWVARHEIRTCVVSDRAAVTACARFADDHRVLVEPACGAALSVVYDGVEGLEGVESVLVVVCGGAGVTRKLLLEWTSREGGLQG